MARVRAGQASGPEPAADRVSGQSVAQGLRTVSSQDLSGSVVETRGPEDRQACFRSRSSPLWFGKRATSLSSSGQDVTRATRQGGSKKQPQEARKAEPGAQNHAEVRGPGHVILNPGSGGLLWLRERRLWDRVEEHAEPAQTTSPAPNHLCDPGRTYLSASLSILLCQAER